MVHFMRRFGIVGSGWARVLFLAGAAVLLSSSNVFAQASDSAARDDVALADPAEFLPAVSLLPQTTQGFVEFQDIPELLDRWEQTSLASLQHDPAMQPFINSQRDAIEAKR